MAKPTLIVFARSPAIGVGKTRLARDVGAVEAWRIYRAMSTRLLWSLRDPRWRLVLRLEGRRGDAAWPKLPTEPQGRGGLGERLERGLRKHARGGVAVIGTDAPQVTRTHIARAFRSRNAIGPATDGGFWLLALDAGGARRANFAGVRWSSAHTLTDTVAVLGELTRLQTLTDVDDLQSLRSSRRKPGSKLTQSGSRLRRDERIRLLVEPIVDVRRAAGQRV
jgi:glycosyltransferase A (GT-A) superfamily protein (DUF2064 family)